MCLVLIVALALVLRFGWVGVSSFAWDEANLSLDALRTVRGGQIALAGQPSSVAIPFFPASVYAFALPYVVSPDPLVATWFVSALSAAAVVGVWALGRRFFGVGAGLLAALFLASSPYAVLYGRSIWQPNLLPPLALAWLASAWWASGAQTSPRRAWGVGLCVFLGGFTIQVHFAGVALVIGTAYLFLRGRWWRQLVPVLIGGAAALAFALPYFVYLAQTPSILDRYAAVLGVQTRYDLTGFENLLKLAFGYGWGYLGGGDGDLTAQNPYIAALVGLLLASGLVALRRRAYAGLVLLALLISPLWFIRHSTPVLPHYQLVALPAVALIAGASVRLLAARGWRVGVALAWLLVASIWTTQLARTMESAAAARMPNSALSSILREPRAAAHAAAAANLPVIVHLHGNDPRLEGEAAVFAALLWGHPQRIIDGDVLLVLPPEPATLMTTLAPFQAWEELEDGGLAQQVIAYPRRDGALPFMTARYDGVTAPAGFTPLEPVTFADGTTLLGWKVRRVGERLRVSTLWRADDPRSDARVQQFHHLHTLETLDDVPFAVSDVPLSLGSWRAGDQVVVMTDFFDLPSGVYALDLGHYTLPDVARIPHADGDRIRLMEVQVP
jgi:hypothetical protein